MSLTDTSIRNAKAHAKPYKFGDSGGLFLLVQSSGGKLWRMKYRVAGREKKLAIGAYPAIGLAEARKYRDEARALIAGGGDPSREKQREKARTLESAAQTFDAVAGEFIEKRKRENLADTIAKKAELFRAALRPSIGSEPVGSVDLTIRPLVRAALPPPSF